MYLHSISINNVSCFSSANSQQTTWMEFDTDEITSNINILIGPNNSGKSQFLSILQIIGNFYETNKWPTSLHKGPQTVSSVWKTTAHERESVTGLSEYIDIEFDFVTKSINSHHSKLSQSKLKHLLEKHITISQTKQTHIHPEIISICDHWLGNNYLCDSIQSGGVSHIRKIMQMCSACEAGGIVLIDEPEAHLHPQLQQKLGSILEQISHQFRIQFFLSTHSSYFINQSNCINVFRFFQTKYGNTWHNPGGFVGSESSLQQILTQNNMSKIFFSRKILLCEGEIDQIFLQRFLTHYKEIRQLKPYQIELDFLPIAGKGSFDMRSRFCRRRKIDAVFMGDRDNLFETNLGSQLYEAKNLFSASVIGKNMSKSQWYSAFITRLADQNEQLFSLIQDKILSMSKSGIYLLQHGDIESYMGIKTKGIESTIDFCKYHFDSRTKNQEYHKKYTELIEIFDKLILKG